MDRAHFWKLIGVVDREALLYVGSRAWAKKTGADEEDWGVQTSVSYETGSNAANWA